MCPEESAGGRPPLSEQQALGAHRAPSSHCVLTVLPVLVFSRPSISPIHSSHLLLRVQRAQTAWLMGKMLKLAAEQWSFLPILLAWSRDMSLSVCREESAVLSWNVGQCSSDSFIPYLSVARETGTNLGSSCAFPLQVGGLGHPEIANWT